MPAPSSANRRRPSPRQQPQSPSGAGSRRARYHSHDHPPPAGPFTAAEAALLAAGYRHVPAHGFTAEALALGARDTGHLDISAAVLPDGPFGLVRWHLHTQRTALADKKKEVLGGGSAAWTEMSVAERVEALTWARLQGNEDIVGRWQEVGLRHAIWALREGIRDGGGWD